MHGLIKCRHRLIILKQEFLNKSKKLKLKKLGSNAAFNCHTKLNESTD